jgi:hypothetical protein
MDGEDSMEGIDSIDASESSLMLQAPELAL